MVVYIKVQIFVFEMDKKLEISFQTNLFIISQIHSVFSCWTCHRELLYFHHLGEEETEAQNEHISQEDLLSICNASLALSLEKILKVQFLPCVSLPCGGQESPWPGALTEELADD